MIDPACGSGNFLTETYLSLRRIENEVLQLIVAADSKTMTGQITFGFEEDSPIQVSIHQFYGIEINDFAVSVAQTALWIAESQTMKETEDIVHQSLDFFPLKTYKGITEGNALRTNWVKVVPVDKLSYIMGNPPFVGYSLQTKEQKADILSVYVNENGKPYKTAGKIDYVAGWYFKAAEIMDQAPGIRTAFVSTNSITQGEQVAGVWKPLYDRFSIHIDFAYRTFIWDSEADQKAHVHCVIVGFSKTGNGEKKIYTEGTVIQAENISPYLIDTETVFVEARNVSISESPAISKGFQATDNGYLILDENEKNDLIKKEPDSAAWIRPYSMGAEFIRKIPRYCLWLVNIKPNELNKLPAIKERVALCKEWRENASKTGDAYKLRDIPHLFRPCKQFKDGTYIAIPLVSSENRRYIPMGFVDNGMIPGNNLFAVFDANLYHFGILTSNVHMSWMRAFGGRLKSDYRYSSGVVYNAFPWPSPTLEQKDKIEKTAQAILDARALYPDSSLADLYDPLTMPPELRKAHQLNDKAVMQAYGMPIKETDEAACVAWLMKLYQEKVNNME